jgi:hypothetical protein
MPKKKIRIDEIGNMESKDGFWEIFNVTDDYQSKKKTKKNLFHLLFVPHDNYSKKDTRISITEEQLIDLLKLCKRIKL